jgi:hypothetical protein
MNNTIKGPCAKCDGRGRIDAFAHYANGVCFWCNGTGEIEGAAEQPAPAPVERVVVLSLKVDGEVFEVISNPRRAFEATVTRPERGDGSYMDVLVGCIWFLDGGRTEASDGMREEGCRLSNEGKRALFAAAREVSRAAEREA